MKEVILDCNYLTSRRKAHQYLAEQLDFPEYYGKNLDALYDCLMELGQCKVILINGEVLEQERTYAMRIGKVFEEAVANNTKLDVIIEKGR